MQKKLSFVIFAAFIGLSACSQGTDLERAMVGAGVGCLVGDLVEEGECLLGAAVGAGAGAIADDVGRF